MVIAAWKRRSIAGGRATQFVLCAAAALALVSAEAAATQVTDSDFVLIKAGKFQMGDAEYGPVHTVTLSRDFLLQKTEVTQAQWVAVMGANLSHFKECGPACPVENVSYEDVQHFIAELNYRSPGARYRLPTEAEWEYAARAGTNGDYGTPGAVTYGGWVNDNSEERTHGAAQLRPNAWGLYDMEGNVWEWVNDWYGAYPSGPVTDPTGPASGLERVLRGGSYLFSASAATSAYRFKDPPEARVDDAGFRLARSP